MLKIDDRVGSLEAGKDADFVIWSGDPLSTLSRAEQTWIDGRKYFDIDADAEARVRVAAERSRLIQKVLDEQFGDDSEGDPGEDDNGEPANARGRAANAGGRSANAGRSTDLYGSGVQRSHAKGANDE
jgi:hypothetical protein